MTQEQLIKIANEKNFRVLFSSDKFNNPLIGIDKGKHSVHWFEIFQNDIYFNHTYSMNTGGVKKGIRHGLNVLYSFAKNI
jgi:hypothetical protein